MVLEFFKNSIRKTSVLHQHGIFLQDPTIPVLESISFFHNVGITLWLLGYLYFLAKLFVIRKGKVSFLGRLFIDGIMAILILDAFFTFIAFDISVFAKSVPSFSELVKVLLVLKKALCNLGSVPNEKFVRWVENPVVGLRPKLGIFSYLIVLSMIIFFLTVLFVYEKIKDGCTLSVAALVFCAVYYLLLKFGLLVGLPSAFMSTLCGFILSLLGYFLWRYGP